MPSFADSIFLFVLALLLFGPKRLPMLARELGKWVGEFRRASNEFKMQMEDELRASEQADRQKQIAAMEAAAPVPPPLEEPEHPHLPRTATQSAPTVLTEPTPTIAPPSMLRASVTEPVTQDAYVPTAPESSGFTTETKLPEKIDGVRPIPIATSGDLQMMPPATGLPTPRPRDVNPLGGLLNSIPEQSAPAPAFAEPATENAAHGD